MDTQASIRMRFVPVPRQRHRRLGLAWPGLLGAGLYALCGAIGAAGQTDLGIGGHFALNTLTGEPVTEQSFKGKWQLIYFGFTLCPDACPTVLSQVRSALKDLGPMAEQVQPLFVTVDPERDTAERLQEYLAHFDPRIVGLRGTPLQTEQAANAYRVYFKFRPLRPGSAAYTIDHSSFLFLMKPDGSFAELLQADSPGHRLADELRKEFQQP